MNNIWLIIKGFFIGLGKIIPGVSGATLAIILGLYEKGIKAISNFKDNIKENTKFLFLVGIGIALALILGSKLIKVSLANYYLPTMLLFSGLILGGFPSLIKGRKINIVIILISIFLIFGISLISQGSASDQTPSLLILIALGMIEAATIVIPGISGTAILMSLGYYNLVIDTLSDITNLANIETNLTIAIPFGIGLFIGILIMSKIITYLFNTNKENTYSAIIGFSIASFLILLIESFSTTIIPIHLIFGLILFIFGFIAAYNLE